MTDYRVHSVLVNHSTNELLRRIVPAGAHKPLGIELLGWNAYDGAGDNTSRTRDVCEDDETWQGLRFPLAEHSLATPLWDRRCGEVRASAQLR